jgi:FKBP-type peptidyl-prolyl cis-trans isomerase
VDGKLDSRPPAVGIIIRHRAGAPVVQAKGGLMKTSFRGMTGWLTRLAPAGLVGLVFVGCDAPPDIAPIAPPGAEVPRKAPDEDPAQAQGEMAAPAIQKKTAPMQVVEYTPAVPTAKGETKTTPGGVKYETLKAGTGPELKAGQTAQFLYVGKLEDGKIFEDRSQRTHRPEMLSLSEKTKGWREALPGMHVGELRKLTVPPELAYGANGRLPEIPPNATLIYEVELVQILGE